MATKKIETSQKGRVCKHPDCTNILSIYNHNDLCHAHLRRLPIKEALTTV